MDLSPLIQEANPEGRKREELLKRFRKLLLPKKTILMTSNKFSFAARPMYYSNPLQVFLQNLPASKPGVLTMPALGVSAGV